MRVTTVGCWLAFVVAAAACAGRTCQAEDKGRKVDANRLTYLDGSDPYYVSRHSPKLITPQWVGEEGVEAVVILGIDDMRGHERWEEYLRPILERLKKIDGRAPVSIMTCTIDPKHPHLQKWLQEGVSLETHTIDHPCPLLAGGDFAKAKSTYDRCVVLLFSVPGNRPVAFRVPCCDSLNTPSPRFFAEIFNKTTPGGNFLGIDTSVCNVFTSNDPEVPRELVIDPDGRDKFRKYIPADRSFVNTVEDYPYPYVINRLCWEFPCVTPSDWSAQHLQKPNNPDTVRDLKAALDITVLKQGVYCLVFHPHGWIRNDQVIELIDHAVEKHGKKVKFLTFREALERLNQHALEGTGLRQDEPLVSTRLLDANNDGFMDSVCRFADFVSSGNVWTPETKSWISWSAPTGLRGSPPGILKEPRFGIFHNDGFASMLCTLAETYKGFHFDGEDWVPDPVLNALPRIAITTGVSGQSERDEGLRFRDLDNDGCCEFIVSNEREQAIYQWSADKKEWAKLPFTLPPGTAIVAADGKDAGLRFVDLDADGYDDVIFSNAERYSIHLFTDMQKGWSKEVMSGKRAEKDARDELPMIVRGDGSNNGFWVHSRHFWWQNEDTAALKDHVDRRSFNELLAHVEPGPKSPEASLRSIRTRPGFEVELVAAEPLVMDPIAFAWGQDGKLWVVEMADYPLGVDDKGQFGGRVRYLEDTDGDGRYDRSTLFLDGLGYPTGVMPWRKGVLVTCAPDIFYAEDRDGDGRADVKEVLFTGFVEGNQQHRVNGLVWGLDNWVYLANGDSGGTIKSLRTPSGSPRSQGGEGEVEISGRDLRIRPDEGLIDPQSGQSQFGRSRDDWGNWFGCNNSNPIYHFVLADHYLRRNAHVAAPDPRRNVSVTPGNAPVYPISRTLERFNDPGNFNRFTSACSVIVYRDELFGPAFAGNAFVSEPVHNLVHREIMSADGLSFTSRRAPDEQQSEFLASSDNWFRPTTIKTGPDGALWIADMYRYVIEHPEWIPDDWEARLDLRAGHDKGRIYRVYPVGRPPRKIPRLDQLSTAELVAALDSPNGWQRDMAQQLLIWRNDMAAVEPLEQLVAQSERAACRLQALCTLDGLGAVRSETIQQALSDPHPGVRRHAVRIAESRLSEEPEVGAAVLRLVNDSDLHVRMQLAYSLGEWDDPRAGQALGRLAVESADSPYLVAAVMSSAANHLDEILPAVFNSTARKTQVPNLLNLAIAVRNENALTGALKNVVTGVFPAGYASWQFDFLGEFLDVLDRRSISLSQLQADAGPHLRSAIDSLSFMFKTARTIARSEERSLGLRVAALRVLGREDVSRQAEDIKTLSSLLVPQTPGDLQEVAVETLGRIRSERVPQLLLDAWPASGPRVRAAILDALLSREPWRRELLDRIENGQVAAGEIDAARRHRLIEQAPQAMRERARTLLAQSQGADRQQVLDAYRAALPSKGDAQRGAAVFEKTCSTCHRVGDVGHDIGPDLKALTDRSPEAMLVAILDPNRAVESKFTSYVAVTTDGRTWTGMLASETGNSITLVSQEGKEQAILRSELESLESTGKSLMPDGVEKDVTPQDVADLLAYLSSAAPGPKPLKNSKPTLVTAGADGTLRLLAASAEIYGDTLVLEDQYGNLGFWSSANDHAVWSLEAPKAGKYEVWLHWACDDRTAGNAFLIEAGAARLSGNVPGTGTWDSYRRAKFGRLALEGGRQRLVLRPAGAVSGFLIDLKAIELVPETPKK